MGTKTQQENCNLAIKRIEFNLQIPNYQQYSRGLEADKQWRISD